MAAALSWNIIGNRIHHVNDMLSEMDLSSWNSSRNQEALPPVAAKLSWNIIGNRIHQVKDTLDRKWTVGR